MVSTQLREAAPVALPDVEIPRQRTASPERVRAAAPVRTRRRWTSSVGGLMAGLAVGAVGAAGATVLMAPTAEQPHLPPSGLVADVRPDVGAGGAGVGGVDAGGRAAADVSVPGRVLTSFGDGTWQVGVDVAPGTYTTTGAVDATSCYHAQRARSARGAVTDRTVAPGSATVVLRDDGRWFETSGCATWSRVG